MSDPPPAPAQPIAGAPSTPSKTAPFVILVGVTAAIGGLLFGHDTGVISGAILYIQQQFNLASQQTEFVTSAVLIGALLGALYCRICRQGASSAHAGRCPYMSTRWLI